MVVYYLARAYAALGCDVRIVGSFGWLNSRRNDYGLRVHCWPMLLRKVAALTGSEKLCKYVGKLESRLLLIMEMWIWGGDIIHAHATYPCGYVATRLMSVFKSTAVVITPHGRDIHLIPELGHGLALDPIIARSIKSALFGCTSITCISEGIRESVLSFGTDQKKVIKIPNGVDTQRFRKVGSRELPDVGKRALNIVSIGNYHIRKGHEVLVNAVGLLASRSENVRLVVIGRKNEKLANHVKTMGIDCSFVGELPFNPGELEGNDRVATLLAEADVYVSASVDAGAEGMSLAVLEAMSSGLPVVATDISGNRDIIENCENGVLVKPGDEVSLADGIVKIVSEPDSYRRMSRNSIKHAENLDWEVVARMYIDHFESVRIP